MFGTRSTIWLLRSLQHKLTTVAELRILDARSCALPALATGSTVKSLQTCSGITSHAETFGKRFSLPVSSSISIRLHRPGNVEVAKGALEEVTFEVGPALWRTKVLLSSVSYNTSQECLYRQCSAHDEAGDRHPWARALALSGQGRRRWYTANCEYGTSCSLPAMPCHPLRESSQVAGRACLPQGERRLMLS